MSDYFKMHLVKMQYFLIFQIILCQKNQAKTVPLTEVNECMYCMCVRVFVCGDGGYYVVVNGEPPALSFTHEPRL